MVLSFSCVLEIPPPTSFPLIPLPPFTPSLLCLFQTLIINEANQDAPLFLNEVPVINVNQIVTFIVKPFSKFTKMMYSIA